MMQNEMEWKYILQIELSSSALDYDIVFSSTIYIRFSFIQIKFVSFRSSFPFKSIWIDRTTRVEK
jgi:hypothetical protein